MAKEYETIIGLEIHAELATATKLFCSCVNDPFFASEPNLYVCPICLGLPGSLPVMNRTALEWAVRVGAALNCQVGWPRQLDRFSKWDRKNYFYPDLPKGYQISQYDLPLDHQGTLEVEGEPIAITRIHLEEDTGRLIHPAGADYSLIDYNRSGVPLLELVTEPVIRSGRTAVAFAQLYQLLLRTLGVSDADMEKGQLRVEANISVRPVGSTTFGTKVEVKNLNSFRSVERAIAFETNRQIEHIEAGQAVQQETRGWDEGKGQTYRQRSKETAAEYRYFPEPDLPPVTLSGGDGINVGAIQAELPELPWDKEVRYAHELAVRPDDARRLALDFERSRYFDAVMGAGQLDGQLLANLILNELPTTAIPPASVRELAELLVSGMITMKVAKDLLPRLSSTDQSPRAIVEAEGLGVVRDSQQLHSLIQEVISAQPQATADYRAGKSQALRFLLGQVMAKTRGQADPGLAQQELERLLQEV